MTGSYLWDPWRTAESDPDRLAVLVDDRAVTFGQLTMLADELRRGLVAADLPDGAVVGTSLPAGPELFSLALAALRGGYGFFPVSLTPDASRRGGLLRAVGAGIDVVTHLADAVTGIPAATVDGLCSMGARYGKREHEPPGAPRAGYLVFTTSGTTGEPTVVARQRPWYSYRGVAVIPRYGAGLDRGPHVMANPTFHLGTLGPALYALQAGSGVVVMPAWSAEQFRDVVDSEQADTAFVSPNQLTDLVAASVAPGHLMSCLFHGGAATPPGIKRQAIQLFGPILHEYYGTSTGLVTEVQAAEWLDRPGTVGRPLPGVHVQVIRDGRELPAGEIGRLQVRYRAIDHNGIGSFVDTGDVGYLDEAGYLFVLGRGSADEAHRMALLEHLIRSLPGVSDAAVVIGTGSGQCVVESLPDTDPGLEDHVRRLCRRVGAGPLAITVGPAGAFPRTPSGKLSRVGLAR